MAWLVLHRPVLSEELSEKCQEIFLINFKSFSTFLAAYRVIEAKLTQASNCSGLVSCKEFASGTWMVPIILDMKVSLTEYLLVVSISPEMEKIGIYVICTIFKGPLLLQRICFRHMNGSNHSWCETYESVI